MSNLMLFTTDNSFFALNVLSYKNTQIIVKQKYKNNVLYVLLKFYKSLFNNFFHDSLILENIIEKGQILYKSL